MNESSLRPVFEEMGKILELAVIRDRNSHLHRGTLLLHVPSAPPSPSQPFVSGCAFLTYQNADAAENAIKKFHDKITFPPVRSAQACHSHAGLTQLFPSGQSTPRTLVTALQMSNPLQVKYAEANGSCEVCYCAGILAFCTP
jgi:RNA recognition motif-containing protein